MAEHGSEDHCRAPEPGRRLIDMVHAVNARVDGLTARVGIIETSMTQFSDQMFNNHSDSMAAINDRKKDLDDFIYWAKRRAKSEDALTLHNRFQTRIACWGGIGLVGCLLLMTMILLFR